MPLNGMQNRTIPNTGGGGGSWNTFNGGPGTGGPGFAGRLNTNPQIPTFGAGGPLERSQMLEANPQLGGPRYNASSAYGPAIGQQAGDYDEIMEGYRGMMGPGAGGYDDLVGRYNTALNSSNNGKYEDVKYTEAPEWGGAYGKASEYANTGGISEGEMSDLRARGISPIRSMYANMQRNMERQKRLGGGGSANYNAVASRMAREGGQQIADKVTDVNAGLAEMQQKGRLSALPTMTGMASGKNELMNQIGLQNAANRLKAGESNQGLLSGYNQALQGRQNQSLNALQGMTSLYGTTPALVNTFGNQMQNQQQMGNQFALGQAQVRNQSGQIAGNMYNSMRGPRMGGGGG